MKNSKLPKQAKNQRSSLRTRVFEGEAIQKCMNLAKTPRLLRRKNSSQ